jgi:adenylate cyclase
MTLLLIKQMPTVRRLRLGSGFLLWLYIATHLSNHALGLWSLAAAEQGLRVAIAIWHSWPGTLLLYGAFAMHLALALTGLYQRHTLRLPPLEWLRIAFGLSFPLLLAGHAIATRGAYEWYGLLPQYQRVIASLVNSGSEGRQIALLAPGWLHGCLGLAAAFRHRAFYRRWRWPLMLLAIALPLASAAGFLLMTQEIGELLQSPDWQRNASPGLPEAHATALSDLRDRVLYVYGGLLAGVFIARMRRNAP